MAMRESKDLNKLELHDLFSNLKAYEFELKTRSEPGPSTSQPTKALATTISEQSSPSKSAEQISNDVMSLFVSRFDDLVIFQNFRFERDLDIQRAFDMYYFSIPHCSSYSISSNCHRFTPPLGAGLVALSSSLLDLLIGIISETWAGCSRRCDESRAFEHFRDFRPIVLPFWLSSWLREGSSRSVEFTVS
ncbi:hypothetical protein F511_23507 [Dorcoceras hygrometricum]|uniref:Uncharacterized protein n=1 Tax=Dorcoceras hygrometricum TaxID=472368 RepID=A0A2Z7DH26_9LAMI|nr:hypothetical protein F511_23507 [Dorcoceras hygrometricum]